MALRAGYYGLKKSLLNKVKGLPGIKSIGSGLNLNSTTGELTATGTTLVIEPNPEGDATEDLNKLLVGETIYKVNDNTKCYQTDDGTESIIVDADYIPFLDSSAASGAGAPKKSTWSNFCNKIASKLKNHTITSISDLLLLVPNQGDSVVIKGTNALTSAITNGAITGTDCDITVTRISETDVQWYGQVKWAVYAVGIITNGAYNNHKIIYSRYRPSNITSMNIADNTSESVDLENAHFYVMYAAHPYKTSKGLYLITTIADNTIKVVDLVAESMLTITTSGLTLTVASTGSIWVKIQDLGLYFDEWS